MPHTRFIACAALGGHKDTRSPSEEPSSPTLSVLVTLATDMAAIGALWPLAVASRRFHGATCCFLHRYEHHGVLHLTIALSGRQAGIGFGLGALRHPVDRSAAV